MTLLLTMFGIKGSGQNNNPFEVRQTDQDAMTKAVGNGLKGSAEDSIDHANPFEIIHVPANYALRDTLKIKKVVPIASNKTKNQNFLFVVISIFVFFLAILVSMNRSILENLWKSVFSDTFLKVVFRVQNSSHTLSYVLFYLFFFLNAGLFLFLFLKHYKVQIFESEAATFFTCIGLVLAIYLLKHLVLLLIGVIFPVEKEVGYYSFMLIAFNIMLGIALLPVNGIISFASDQYSTAFIIIGVGLFVLFYAIRQFRGMLLAGNFIADQKFHFFVYLCTVEIAPVMIITKLILTSS